jgi:hypothetical protein
MDRGFLSRSYDNFQSRACDIINTVMADQGLI